MTVIKQKPPYHIGQIVDVLAAQDDRTDYYSQMEVTAINGSEVTLSRGINYNPAVMEYYYGKDA